MYLSGTRNGLARRPIDDKEPEHAEIGRDWTKHYRIGSKFNAICCLCLAAERGRALAVVMRWAASRSDLPPDAIRPAE
ncbi:unnamed protein product [Pieris brassicae]|uniref:Uncharacterized protein n=1 Tax=Pieris brassicae TaxID=7116 RepID=A0A9P0TD53_PIEBR|nr:unnamed protein product [Pieris brassicae]